MDLTTRYLGFDLPHPLMPGASPLVDNLDMVRRLEDAGASMITMHSLFEEQITMEQAATDRALDLPSDSFAEATSYLPEISYNLGPDQYLEQLRKIKAAVAVPVVASLNGTHLGGWLEYAKLMEQAGADAIELNVYELATDADESGLDIEQRTLDMVRQVNRIVNIPLAVKLSPFYTAMAHFAKQLEDAGADALVLFNRLYQPDLDIEQLEVVRVNLSHSAELLLRLRWLGILSGRVQPALAITGGVHTHVDVIKSIMAGAHGVQLVSCLLQRGPEYLRSILDALVIWMEEHEYESLDQMRGSLSLSKCPDPKAYERANYVQILQSWKV